MNHKFLSLVDFFNIISKALERAEMDDYSDDPVVLLEHVLGYMREDVRAREEVYLRSLYESSTQQVDEPVLPSSKEEPSVDYSVPVYFGAVFLTIGFCVIVSFIPELISHLHVFLSPVEEITTTVNSLSPSVPPVSAPVPTLSSSVYVPSTTTCAVISIIVVAIF